jgi:hypothetical protein
MLHDPGGLPTFLAVRYTTMYWPFFGCPRLDAARLSDVVDVELLHVAGNFGNGYLEVAAAERVPSFSSAPVGGAAGGGRRGGGAALEGGEQR